MQARQVVEKKDSMPPKLDSKSDTERVHFVAPSALLDRISEWRSRQRPIPSLSQAIRRLVEERLDQEQVEGRPGPEGAPDA